MSVKVHGLKDVEKQLNSLYSSRKANKMMNDTVNAGAEVVEERLKQTMKSHKDTGYTADAVTRSKARNSPVGRVAKVGFSNEKGRASLIHLGEFGYTIKGLRVNTPAFGSVQKVVNSSGQDYFAAAFKEARKFI